MNSSVRCGTCGILYPAGSRFCSKCGAPLIAAQAQKPVWPWIVGGVVAAMIVVVLLLSAISIPAFMKARNSARRNACVNNLRMIDNAKDQYAMEYACTNGAVLKWENLELYIRDMRTKCYCPTAPAANRSLDNYKINPLGANPECQIDQNQHFLPPSWNADR